MTAFLVQYPLRRLVLACGLAAVLSAPAHAQSPPKPAPTQAPAAAPGAPAKPGSTLDSLGGDNKQPLEVQAANGIEWQQDAKVYIARGNASAKRGNVTVFGDTLYAYYRQVAGSESTEIFRLVSEGNVKVATPTQTVVGDRAVYDIDTALAVVTGKALKLTTPQDVVTARDSLEWYDQKQLAVARGDAVAIRGDRRVRADTLTAVVQNEPGKESHITRVDGTGNVFVSGSRGELGRGNTGIYDVDKGITTLAGKVSLVQGQSVMRGEYGVVDLNRNVGRLLPAPPGTQAASGGPRVQGLIMPREKPQPPSPNPR